MVCSSSQKGNRLTSKASFTLNEGLLAHANEPWASPSGAFNLQPVSTGKRKSRIRDDHRDVPIEVHPSFKQQTPVRSPRASR